MEEFKEISKEKKKRIKNTYPIYMDKVLIEKVRNWQDQVKDKFSGMVSVTVSDVCSEVLLQASVELNDEIISKIENNKLDPVKKLKLLLNKAIEASQNDKELSFESLLEENKKILGLDKKPSKKRKRRVKISNEIVENRD